MNPTEKNHLRTAIAFLFVAFFSLAALSTRPSHFGLVAAAQATPTPVNGKIAFASRRNPKGIYVMEPDGSNQTLLLAEDNISDGTRTLRFPENLEWSPDGTKLAFDSGDDRSQIFVVNADGTGLAILTSGSPPSFSPTWSPDGTRIAFSRFGAIWVMNADGTNQRLLVNGGIWPNWSHDGTKIVFTGFTFPDTSGNRDIFVVDSAGTNPPTQLTNPGVNGIPSQVGLWFNQNPVWSPDDQQIAFTSRGSDRFNGDTGIWVMRADGSGPHPIISTGLDPAWSPDGTKIAFAGLDGDFNLHISVVNVDGSGSLLTLTNGISDNRFPAWKSFPPQANTPAGTNVTVQSGDVAITFDNVTAAGNTTVTPIDPATLGGLPGQYQLLNGSQAFEITTTATYSGNITICFNVIPPVADVATFDTLRILHGEGGAPVDRTILAPDSPAPTFGPPQTICARVTSLSPFVVARLINSNQPPVARAKDITVAADGSCVASITPGDVDNGSFDPDSGDTISLSLDQSGPFSLGTHAVTLTATDSHGATSTAAATVTIIDNTPPSITGAAVDKTELGPPNHKLVDVMVHYNLTDNCDSPVATLAVASNEPVNDAGDGNTAPDWEVVDAHHVRLRAERSGHGGGRIYTITITATDGSGNSSSRTVTVRVPHN